MSRPADNTSVPSQGSAPAQGAGSLADELIQRLDSYRELIDFARAIVWRADAQTFQFTFVSIYAETLLGYPLRSWTDDPEFWKEHIHPEDRERTVAQCVNATRENKEHELEYRMIAADGRTVWLSDIVRVVVKNGRPAELVGVMVDITEKKDAEEAVRQSSARLRQIVDTIPAEIWSGPPDGTIDFVNERWRSELGLTLEDVPGDAWQKMLHPDDRARVLEAWKESVRSGTPYEQEERHRQADGEYRWALSRGLPLRDKRGQIVRWFGSNTDIENQKRAEDELRKSERRWRAIFENSAVGVALLDSSLHYVTVNAALEKMLGYSSDELRSYTCVALTVEEDRLHYKALIDELLQGKRDRFELEKRYCRKNGGLVWTHTSGSVVAGTSGESRLWVAIVKDITERVRLREQLQRERDRLRLLLDLNNAFVSKLDIRDFFSALATSLREVEGWVYPAILLPGAESNHLHIYLGGGPLKEGMSVPIEGTAVGKVYRSGQPEFFRMADLPPVAAEYAELASWRKFARADGLDAAWNLPLVHDGNVLGVLAIHTRHNLESAKADLPFLEELAKLVAIALHNALRYGELSESHERLAYQKSYIEEQIRVEFGFESIIGQSKGLRNVLKQVDVVAPTDTTVLVLGETGTGKELIARAIHDRSLRRTRSFIKVDCSTIPANLMESELFGHEKGAFTGAVAQKLGRVEAADQGTLFLDEIGDVPLELQTKLLRLLQDQAFERLGSNRTQRLDVRFVAATNRDLESMVQKGEFREDLYYRLKVFPILIPPLRERPEDIPPLVRHYVQKYAQRMRKQINTIPATAMKVFTQYPWPGNVRELRHFMERSVVLTSGDILQAPLRELEQVIQGRRGIASAPVRTMEQIERDSILQALRESDWVVGGPDGAAAKLGLKRTTLSSRMEKHGISRRQTERKRS
jgi:formate hydrogenlyase transcriptional activator